ncbi:hypothetical protein NDK23_19720 [Stenotrophomonas maltophilia]|uniref:hypothetical protein n=1 Tax=Stenotrophomonas maltophilia TaxID=40324 RepID=UPI0020363FDC|nr:hypothetical protein [Stenotrophomonas maltophilia]USA16232.1 hypothetical protein NDK23_19720 [Stenotrophomonas maltophilia]
MQNELRSYIASNSMNLAILLSSANRLGVELYVEVHREFPSVFIDTLPLLARMCTDLSISVCELDRLCQEFCESDQSTLHRLNGVGESRVPYKATASFLLMLVVARRNRDRLTTADLEAYGWSTELAGIVLEHRDP